MEERNLGRSGLKVSAVGLGCNNFGMLIDAAASQVVVDKAIELGVTLFDTADYYGDGKSEEYLGKAVGARRQNVLIATKFAGWQVPSVRLRGGGSRDTVMRAAEGSLRRLGTDYIDLYQIHLPDPETPIEETMRALDDLVRQGKVRYIGHSNFSGWQAADAAWTAKLHGFMPFASAQNYYSVLSRGIEKELVPACNAHGVGILPYLPLEGGILTGKYKRGQKPAADTRYAAWAAMPGIAQFYSDEKFAKADRLAEIAAARGHKLLDVAIGWLLSKPYVCSVIAGATKPGQVEANVAAAAWRPTSDEAAKIDEITMSPRNNGLPGD